MDKKITLYTTHCPLCKVLQARLDAHKVPYEMIDEEEVVYTKAREFRVASVPFITVKGEEEELELLMLFNDAIEFICHMED